MAALGPFEPAPRIAAGVSGGADSMALALLADAWARQRGGSLLALVVDHGLRTESGREAAATRGAAWRARHRGAAAGDHGLARGPALPSGRARRGSPLLEAACAEAGILHLLLGHHAGDQAETLLIRSLGGSGPAGMAGMAPLVETDAAAVAASAAGDAAGAAACDAGGCRRGMGRGPVERRCDGAAAAPAPAAARPRRRRLGDRRPGCGRRGFRPGAPRSGPSASLPAWREGRVRPEGFALLSGQPLQPPALAALLQTIAGAPFPPATRSVAALAAAPRPATLAGVRLLPAGRLGPGLLAVREAAAMAPPVPRSPAPSGTGGFASVPSAALPAGATLGALGDDAARLRRFSPLPSAVLRTLPAVRLRR